jgi:DNA segregation ATPase FtsK/SpoIIIE, S-DNA-T family
MVRKSAKREEPTAWQVWLTKIKADLVAGGLCLFGLVTLMSMATVHAGDPSINVATAAKPKNQLGSFGATLGDLSFQLFGVIGFLLFGVLLAWGIAGFTRRHIKRPPGTRSLRATALVLSVLGFGAALSVLAIPRSWQWGVSMGGLLGDGFHYSIAFILGAFRVPFAEGLAGIFGLIVGVWGLAKAMGVTRSDLGYAAEKVTPVASRSTATAIGAMAMLASRFTRRNAEPERPARRINVPENADRSALKDQVLKRKDDAAFWSRHSMPRDLTFDDEGRPVVAEETPVKLRGEPVDPLPMELKRPRRDIRIAKGGARREGDFAMPQFDLLATPPGRVETADAQTLDRLCEELETVLLDFGVKGQIVAANPGPVVTLFEFEPAPGVKSARVISLADDIARSMSALAVRVAVVPGRNVIGIELPNERRETVYLRTLFDQPHYAGDKFALPLALGETIGGAPFLADLARMPHLLIAGTTGSGKSVGINAMILSLLYKLPPEKCRFIMIDPKMLELSVYDGIPHLLAPVVTDPKKAVSALKWTVREMEARYRKMSGLGVRNISGFNRRVADAKAAGETLFREVQTGFDPETRRPIIEREEIPTDAMAFIVVVIDEMADLMLVAGKEIEALVQRLAQMARAAGIHLITATQRPSVDVITGTIKANFPTRISFQVTSRIDSRTIIGDQGAEQLLGQGDLLYMANGGRIQRLHGPFVSDGEVEGVAAFLKEQGAPDYVDGVTDEPDEETSPVLAAFGGGEDDSADLYDQAVAIVTRDQRASTSYIQRRLQIGYNRAATLIERMEQEGVISSPNAKGHREILAGPPPEY